MGKPLFTGGYAQLAQLSSQMHALSSLSASGTSLDLASSSKIEVADVSREYWLADPSQALVYEPPDEQFAAKIAKDLEAQLEADILEYRSMGEHSGGVQCTTTFNRVIANRLGELLNSLELLSCYRRK